MGRNSVLITGSSGVGKTVIIESMLKKLASSGFSFKSNTILGDVFNYASKTKVNVMTNNMSSLYGEDAENNKKVRIEDYGSFKIYT